MSKLYEGMLLGEGLKFGLVMSRFNEFITKKLLEGARDALLRHGAADEDVSAGAAGELVQWRVVASDMQAGQL